MKARTVQWGALAMAAVLAMGLVGCAPKYAPRINVKTASAHAGRIVRTVEFSGVLVPNHTVNIFAKIAGQATTVTVDVGDRVKAGQLMVQIDTKELNAQLAVAEAAAAGVGDQAVQVKSGVETARLNLEMAQRTYERTKTLLDTKVVTQSQLDDAQTKLDLAKTAYDNSSRQYQTITGSGLAQAEAQVNYIKVQISNSTITSPLSGIVTNRNINPGEITSTTSPLFSVADVATLKLQGNVSQEDVVRIPVGGKVSVSVDALPTNSYAGRVEQVGPIAASTGQYFPVVVSLKNDGRLLAGMTAKASFTWTGADGVLIPLSAVRDNQDGRASVFVVSGGKVQARDVSLGARDDTDVQVISGLSASEQVAISNVSALVNGMEVSE
ncbi:MAG TPA: efflux RND transporter periplasmic adaptor subunit [Spirochaetia bacterium]|nr:efflux RND transporter periplasmic adaptor subunit [Spirochaetia bacterium]